MTGEEDPEDALPDEERVSLALAVIEGIPDAVILADRNGAIRFWNDGAARIFGFTRGEALGQPLDIIIPERLRKRHWDGYHHMMETGERRYEPERLLAVPAQTKSGETLSIQFTVAPVRDAEGKVSGIAAVLRDVTATHEELKRLRTQAST